ncbi:enoyl-CoA hydratase/isomerase family protein [Cupriavidus basilensis]
MTQDILLADKQGDVTRLTLEPARARQCAVGRAGGGARGGGAGVPPRRHTPGCPLRARARISAPVSTWATWIARATDSLLARFVRVELLLQSLHGAPFTTVALVQGQVMGAGADLLAACEQRWVAQGSSFAFPGAAFGLVLGSARLAGLVGVATAREWIASGRAVRTEEALAAGLAGTVVEPEARAAALTALAARARRLDAPTQAAIHAATLGGPGAADAARAAQLAELVRSAARPGLKARIAAYREASRR